MNYTEKRKVRIKKVVVSLWFDMAHLTDCLLEAVNVCQDGNRGRESIPLNNCQGEKMSICGSQSKRKFACMPMGGKSERCGSRGWHMKGVALRRIHVLFYRKGPVVSQQAPAQGYASQVFPASLRHLNMVSNHPGPIEPPVSGPPPFSVCHQEYVGPRPEQHTPAGDRQWPWKLFL